MPARDTDEALKSLVQTIPQAMFLAELARRAACWGDQPPPKPPAPAPPADLKKSSTVDEFCARRDISRSHLYSEWREGRGPRSYLVGKSRRITDEAELDWVAAMESEAAKAAEAAQAAEEE